VQIIFVETKKSITLRAILKKSFYIQIILKTMNAIQFVHEQLKAEAEAKFAAAVAQAKADGKPEPAKKAGFPAFKSGDNIVVNYKIIEGDKVRVQAFRGDVIQVKGEGATKTFTVRKISNGVGVERILPFSSPNIESIEVLKRGKVRRARLYYLRNLTGKQARIKELKG
jgi:large subunit ribosomal protein L19